MSSIEKEYKGFIEKFLDEADFEYLAEFWGPAMEGGLVDSEKSAIIGHLYGDSMTSFLLSKVQRRQMLTADEVDDCTEIFFEKIAKINSKIDDWIKKC